MTQQTTSSWTGGEGLQNSVGGFAQDGTQYNWQQYYAYAQQLYSAGNEAEAVRYYTYAKQLYEAMVQSRQSQAASSAQGYVEPAARRTVDPADAPQATSPAAWETYYNYAQQLYAAGYEQQAEVYYRQAQQLFAETTQQVEYETAAVGISNSIAPQYDASASSSYAPPQPSNASSSYMPAAVNQTLGGANAYAAAASPSYSLQNDYPSYTGRTSSAPSTGTVSNAYAATQRVPAVSAGTTRASAADWASMYAEDEPQKPPKRGLKKRVKLWTGIISAMVAVFAIVGIVALFGHYKDQLHRTDADKAQDTSMLNKLKNATIAPIIDALKPGFDKAIRLSDAAQPLLYELSLRDTPPSNFTLNASMLSMTPETPKPQPVALPPEPIAAASTASVEIAQPEAPTANVPRETPALESREGKEAPPIAAVSAAETSSSTEGNTGEKVNVEQETATPVAEAETENDESAKRVSEDPQKAEDRVVKPAKKTRAKGPARHHRRQARKSAQSASSNTNVPWVAPTQPPKKTSKKRGSKSGLSDDPLGSFTL